MPIAISCPSCEAELRLRDELAGRKVRCPRCGGVIAVPRDAFPNEVEQAEEVRPEDPPKTGSAARRRQDRDLDDDDEERPRRRRGAWEDDEDEDDRPRRRRRREETSNRGLLYGLIGGGVAIIVAAVVLVLMLSSGRRNMPGGAGPAGNPMGGGIFAPNDADKGRTLAEARKGFTTRLIRKERLGQPVPEPPPNLFRKVQFDAALGKLTACLTPDPKDNKKRPAIIWLTGGDCNSIDDSVWQNAPANNDQTASAFRQAGIVMMFPTLRGGNDNPGVREGFFGEVDDVIAAADYLAKVNYVDPQRIYLGGHSTGGTLVLLTAECSARFRAVFSFGPVEDVAGYGAEFIPFDAGNRRELELRAPVRWLHAVRCPVHIFEGNRIENSNLPALEQIRLASTNPLVHCYPINGGDHFNILQPITRVIAQKVLRDDGPSCNLAFDNEELNRLMGR
jgi:predicted Zn finger-like uncharacterized protein